MKFFVDAADISEIRELATAGVLDGVTTNPSLIAKTGRPIRDVIKEVCQLVDGPVSAEVTATDFDGMIAEGERLADIAAAWRPFSPTGVRLAKRSCNANTIRVMWPDVWPAAVSQC